MRYQRRKKRSKVISGTRYPKIKFWAGKIFLPKPKSMQLEIKQPSISSADPVPGSPYPITLLSFRRLALIRWSTFAAWNEKICARKVVEARRIWTPRSSNQSLSEQIPPPQPYSTPSTNTPAGLPPWNTILDEARLNVKPPTLQRAGTAPELKNHGAVNVAVDPARPEKLPSALITDGEPVPPVPLHAVTSRCCSRRTCVQCYATGECNIAAHR